jgi:hypothetical protein
MRLLCSYEPPQHQCRFPRSHGIPFASLPWIVISPAILATPYIEEMTRGGYDDRCPKIGQLSNNRKPWQRASVVIQEATGFDGLHLLALPPKNLQLIANFRRPRKSHRLCWSHRHGNRPEEMLATVTRQRARKGDDQGKLMIARAGFSTWK